MFKKNNLLTVSLIAFMLGFSANNFALSGVPANFSVAIVDIPRLVSDSSQVGALKEQQKKNQQALFDFAKNAREDVAKVSDEKKKKELEEKYNKQLNEMKNSQDEKYRTELSAIDANITKIIQREAKAKKYDLVLTKGVVLYGGEDITEAISKQVK